MDEIECDDPKMVDLNRPNPPDPERRRLTRSTPAAIERADRPDGDREGEGQIDEIL
jgi:hypothetical protein